MDSKVAESILDEVENLDCYGSDEILDNLILDVKGASRLLGVCPKTIYRHLEEIPHKRIGPKQIRFLLPDLIQWFKS